ncbi:GGDEF domain-containing protein [Sphingomonas morindae]|uniref:diguanylate cyclase n=1 Tax=Sphingomonas morindae TaxID=1541170 RepID=A0ABY4XAI8_9SPHN|nr:GGDEF domain-containing protein [Sphingomonas morindae]USI73981.1 GGDEF domain-containing protein [Sphingomonas morindae]
MRFYLATGFLFPRDFRLRLFLLCFLGTHLPLVTLIGWQLATHSWRWPPVLAVLIATMAGALLALSGAGALLAPIDHATEALLALQRGERVTPLPSGGEDQIGRLLTSVTAAAAATRQQITRLDAAAHDDALTGLRNRRGFLERVTPQLRLSEEAALALVDLDHFKKINDHYGHGEGDRVLQAFAGRLRAGLRRLDVVARWGGEEFAIFFPGTPAEEAACVVERIRQSLIDNPLQSLEGRPISFSSGVASVRFAVGDPIGDALGLADAALYAAKRGGRDQVRVAPVQPGDATASPGASGAFKGDSESSGG